MSKFIVSLGLICGSSLAVASPLVESGTVLPENYVFQEFDNQ